MRYLLLDLHGEYRIINEDIGFTVAYLHPLPDDQYGPRFRVSDYRGDDVGVVRSPREAISAFSTYYEKNPPAWERESETCYTRDDQFGGLQVRQIRSRQWVASRDSKELMHNGSIALFATPEEAQRAADAHVRDDYPDPEFIRELLRNGSIAVAEYDEAQRAVDARVRDGYPNSETVTDGFSWLAGPEPWWTDPYTVANLAKWAVRFPLN
jgi:hypothetical protein